MSDLTNINRTAQAVARELIAQPELLSAMIPEQRRALPETSLPGRYTGERSTSPKHDERNLFVGALHMLGYSDRQIEQACHAQGFSLTRRSIPIIVRDLEHSGRITPQKERLAMQVGDLAELSASALRDLLHRAADGGESVELAAMIKSAATSLGITVEKLQLLTGAATERIEAIVGTGRGEIEAWAKEFAIPVEATARPVDTQSAANPTLSAQTNTLPPMRHASDTSAQLTSPNAPTPAADPNRSEATGADPGGGLSSRSGTPESPTNQ